jgi:hypothetical protein
VHGGALAVEVTMHGQTLALLPQLDSPYLATQKTGNLLPGFEEVDATRVLGVPRLEVEPLP